VARNFAAAAPNRLWVADITYIPTAAGFLYLAVVLDAFSRRVVGWAMSTALATQLVLDALEMALAQRKPDGVIHHSDQGSQYTSIAFGTRCRAAGVRPSMGSVGEPTTMRCTARPLPIPLAGRGAHGNLQLHRGVV
jgi:putative transposase